MAPSLGNLPHLMNDPRILFIISEDNLHETFAIEPRFETFIICLCTKNVFLKVIVNLEKVGNRP